MMPHDTQTIVAQVLNRQRGIEAGLIQPKARLSQDLGLGWEEADNMFSELADWSPFDGFAEDAKLDYWTVHRGLDRHYLSPYRRRDERNRLQITGRGVPLESRSITLEPLTIADAVRIVHAKRYVCRTPPVGIEEIVVRNVQVFSRQQGQQVTLDSRLREDLGFEWGGLRRVLVAADQELGGAFYWGAKGRTWRAAYLYWQAMEFLKGTPPLRVSDLVATVRENRWIGPMEIDWRSAIPGLREGRAPHDEEILLIVKWLLVEQGVNFVAISPESHLGGHLDVLRASEQIESMFAGRFVLGEEIKRKLRSTNPGFTFRVADLVHIVQASW